MGISSLGVGSGLDSESIVTQLAALQREPINTLKTAASKIDTKISTYGSIKSALSTLQTAAQKLLGSSLWSSTAAKSADNTAVSVAAGSTAAAGTYNVSVQQLASSQSVVSQTSFASSGAILGSGRLTIQLGSWDDNGLNFAPKSGSSAVTIDIAETDSLDKIRDKINASGAGVTASIITDANGARLVMQSKATGAQNGFRVTAEDGPASNLSALAYDPDSGSTGTRLTQAAANAKATVNGVEVETESNTLSNVVDGLTMTLNKVSTTPTAVTVTQDTDAIVKAITEFASAQSSLMAMLQNNTKYDASTGTAGALQGDSTAVSILNQLRSVLQGTTNASSVYATLSAVGLTTNTHGGLAVDTTKLTNALQSNPEEVKKLFAKASLTDDSQDGFAVRVNTLAQKMLSFDGIFATRTEGLQALKKSNTDKQSAIEARAASYEKLLRAQYAALDQQMASLTSQSNYVTQMINSFNASKK